MSSIVGFGTWVNLTVSEKLAVMELTYAKDRLSPEDLQASLDSILYDGRQSGRIPMPYTPYIFHFLGLDILPTEYNEVNVNSTLDDFEALYFIAISKLLTGSGVSGNSQVPPTVWYLDGLALSSYGYVRSYLEAQWQAQRRFRHRPLIPPNKAWLKTLLTVAEARIEAGLDIYATDAIKTLAAAVKVELVADTVDILERVKTATDLG